MRDQPDPEVVDLLKHDHHHDDDDGPGAIGPGDHRCSPGAIGPGDHRGSSGPVR